MPADKFGTAALHCVWAAPDRPAHTVVNELVTPVNIVVILVFSSFMLSKDVFTWFKLSKLAFASENKQQQF